MSESEKIDYSRYLVEDPKTGKYQVDRRIFTDPELFELELKYVWEKVWVYMCHESQIPKKKDFITGHIGRQPVIINRNKKGEIGGYINACRHRGVTLCRTKMGNTGLYSCPFHGWVYDTTGKLVNVKDEDKGGYPPEFDKSKLGLAKLPGVTSYRGFIFATLNENAHPLEDWLGETTRIIDMLVDQSPQGLEVLKGSSTYTFDANWKAQAENGVDGYHVSTVHWNYVATMKNRAEMAHEGEKTKAMDAASLGKLAGGYFDFGHGHTLLWSDWSNPEDRPIYSKKAELEEKFGEAETNWMIGRLRNQLIYPSMFLMDQMSSQIRMFRPLAADKTEVTIYVIAPVGEPAEERKNRLRQYEDFFNASGMATSDDLSEFDAGHIGALAEYTPWSDISRGAIQQISGPNQYADEIGLTPFSSGAKIEDEGLFLAQHRYWVELMNAGQAAENIK
ncbi:MAG: benzoate 1,2-dioxygenase large subunit [Gammaproteobacteria bacterium]|nr:MAG: benzoate 1,2-dioxygenase large subunit [Gammaproteobacteria bacterium]RLA24487.1 MAG: benzoate 1,2-dioxygenase large subunit [Gammaproteobacteria bacterium]